MPINSDGNYKPNYEFQLTVIKINIEIITEPAPVWVSPPKYSREAHHEHSFNEHLPLSFHHSFLSTPFQL